MIRRHSGSTFQLITQTDHAALSGFLASHLGNESFSKPSAEVVAAIAAHDGGWPLHDDQPTLNAAGKPLHVFETPPTLSTRIWSASVEHAAPLGPYAQLLVSLHQLNLSDFVLRRPPDVKSAIGPLKPRDIFELNKFQHRQIELQESLRKQIGLRTDVPLTLGLAKQGTDGAENQLRFDFRWLVFCDSLSLELCCGKPLFPVLRDVFPGPRLPPINIRLERESDNVIKLAPWPFDAANISADVPYRPLPNTPLAADDDFRVALAKASVENLRLELHALK